MRHVPVAEFKDKASEFIAAAERGEEIVITRHGKPAVRLVAVGDDVFARRQQALSDMAVLRSKLQSEGVSVSIDEMIAWKNEGRP